MLGAGDQVALDGGVDWAWADWELLVAMSRAQISFAFHAGVGFVMLHGG